MISGNLNDRQYNVFSSSINPKQYDIVYKNYNYTAIANKIDIVSLYQEATKSIATANISFFLENY